MRGPDSELALDDIVAVNGRCNQELSSAGAGALYYLATTNSWQSGWSGMSTALFNGQSYTFSNAWRWTNLRTDVFQFNSGPNNGPSNYSPGLLLNIKR